MPQSKARGAGVKGSAAGTMLGARWPAAGIHPLHPTPPVASLGAVCSQLFGGQNGRKVVTSERKMEITKLAAGESRAGAGGGGGKVCSAIF